MNYWRTTTGAEVDFILSQEKQLVPIEIKSKFAKITRAFRSFIQHYKPKKGIIFNLEKISKCPEFPVACPLNSIFFE
jgi:hypothetical protein